MAKTIDEIFEKEESKHLSQLKKEDIEWLNSQIKERAGGVQVLSVLFVAKMIVETILN
ncbi:hypothetical protein [Campylobacter showae]|uniref:Uncharacterized protein n=1 Tax=Campylobacter showae CSUNSWCD TaxID=1244083 RepID=M5IQW8_9BACT|nr:hypothetical protein [Campylobacter showae]EKU11481.1 hypothetical protein CSUNSWCD_1807 [Campylobacter showae CSUNSWCD]